ncbi:hypothetical protein QUF99_11165 [Bacillus sp. DX4.1]|uniref:hypothetical protein n=1 Tax=Bacillus sp. DX4.1 TaxID=3055867 RepID=UPI00259FF3FE|nr:hypothetical protein [Bacillus sp. DX4.1]MDM5187869.1 hypothetical protein [Bacillus sp. DX4.1]
MGTIQNLKEMEKLAITLTKTDASPKTKVQIGRLLELFGEESVKFGGLYQALSDELAELEDLRRFIKSQGLSENFSTFRKIGSR